MNGGMIVTGENSSTWGKIPGPMSLFPPPTSHGLTWDRIHASAAKADDEPPEPWHGPDFNVKFK